MPILTKKAGKMVRIGVLAGVGTAIVAKAGGSSVTSALNTAVGFAPVAVTGYMGYKTLGYVKKLNKKRR